MAALVCDLEGKENVSPHSRGGIIFFVMGEVRLSVPTSALLRMKDHVEEMAPEEACGLLSGADGRVLDVHPVENAEHSPVRFRMAPAEQVGAMLAIERRGCALVAIYHSHPQGPSGPSAADLAEAAYPVPHFIWTHEDGKWRARLFLLEGDTAHEISFCVSDAMSNETAWFADASRDRGVSCKGEQLDPPGKRNVGHAVVG
jgi:proteasome lid subunit RPN8/RPN11